MTSVAAWRCSLSVAVLLSAGLGCGGTSGDSTPSSTAGTSSSSGGSAGTTQTGSGGSAGSSTSTAGTSSGTAGSVSNPSGGTSSGGAGASGSTQGGSSGASGAAQGGASGMTGNAGTGGGSAGTGGAAASDCPATDPLKTNKAKQDAYDCAVLQVSAKWGMPDPMIVKCQIQQESSFNVFAISGDSPCGIMQGWTDAESKSFGLIQTTPACGEAKSALLPNGHPNLDQDMSSALWATSVFNPTINLDEGVKTDTDSLKALQKKYPGCTVAQYNMMAAGAFNSGNNAVLGCGMYNARAQMYVDAITTHYHQFAPAAGWPDPY
jgi:hypothetical protein